MILITSSRKPSRRTRSLMRDLSYVVPHSVRLNRGKSSLWDLSRVALSKGLTRILVIWEDRGNPRSFVFYRVSLSGVVPLRPAIYFTSVKLRRELFAARPPRISADTLCVVRVGGRVDRITEILSEGMNVPPPLEVDHPIEASDCDVALVDEGVGGARRLNFIDLRRGVELGPILTLGGTFEFGGEG